MAIHVVSFGAGILKNYAQHPANNHKQQTMDPIISQLQHARAVSDGTHLAVYEVKQVYGRPLAYPVNDQAETFQGLTCSKTLRPQDISTIERLGFNVVTVHGERLKPSMIE